MELAPIIEDRIITGSKHANYNRTVELAKMYRDFILNQEDHQGNQPLNDYLRRFVRREDEDLFEQRKNLTKHYLPSICTQIIRPFQKVMRSNRVAKLIDHKESKVVADIDEALKLFYGDTDNNGLEQFLATRFLPLTFTDPNAWICVAFKDFDDNLEKPQPFPVEYQSKTVVDFEIKNDQTQWLMVKLEYEYEDKDGKTKLADRWLIYGKDIALEYKAIPKDIKETFVDGKTLIWEHPKDNSKKFAVYTYDHKSGCVPLIRTGYILDPFTDSVTYVNPFHYEALPIMKQFLKVSSELQLGITLHVFPKQVTYVAPCEAKGCIDGALENGQSCAVCLGTGKKHHTTSADIMELPLPNSKLLGDLPDASKLSTYIPFPGGVMDFLDKYADKLEEKIMRKVFNSDSILQTQFQTATEAEIDVDSVYDTLHPFADKYSEIWMFITKLIAKYRSHNEVTVYHKFNSDYKFKPLGQLLSELKTANDSGAPSYVRESITNDISEIIYADDQTELSKLKIKNRHYPFPGKTDFEIQNIILNNLTTRFNQILYANFDSIFEDIEMEMDGFYKKTFALQRGIIRDKVDEIILAIDPAPLNLADDD